VLLKNDRGALPLPDRARIAVVGEFARTPRFQGGGSSRVNPTRVDVPLDAIRALAAERGSVVTFAAGFTLDGSGDAAALRRDAAEAARVADVAVVFAGLAESDESEGFDRTTLDLPAAQVELIGAVAEAAPRTVVVLSHGGVVSLEGWHADVDAILEGFLLGQAGGSALADVLFGVANPSGRLAETIPVRLADTASFVNFPGEQGSVRYGEGVMVGYRWHEEVGIPARYPFGHGLSYTTFATTGLAVEVTGSDTARATVTVAHVVQVYVATGEGPVRRPVRELRAFTKVHLQPGESRTVSLNLERRAFAYWDVQRPGWAVAPGTYAVQLCQDAATVTAERTVTLAGDTLVRELTLQSTVEEWYSHPAVGPALLADLAAGVPAGQGIPAVTPELLRMIGSMPMQKVVDMLAGAVPASTFDRLMAGSRPTAAVTTHGDQA
jgi:beta-glucosidase